MGSLEVAIGGHTEEIFKKYSETEMTRLATLYVGKVRERDWERLPASDSIMNILSSDLDRECRRGTVLPKGEQCVKSGASLECRFSKSAPLKLEKDSMNHLKILLKVRSWFRSSVVESKIVHF